MLEMISLLIYAYHFATVYLVLHLFFLGVCMCTASVISSEDDYMPKFYIRNYNKNNHTNCDWICEIQTY